jgi:hypothetical protein
MMAFFSQRGQIRARSGNPLLLIKCFESRVVMVMEPELGDVTLRMVGV